MDELLMSGYPSLNSDDIEFDGDSRQLPSHLQSTPSSRHQRTNSLQALDRLTTKIACTKESIRKEQTARDGKKNSIQIVIVNNFYFLNLQIMSTSTLNWQQVLTNNSCIE